MNAEYIKKHASRLGADLCGIAPVERFAAAPAGFHPRDIDPGACSVVVFAAHMPLSCLRAKTNVPYTLMRNHLLAKMDMMVMGLVEVLEKEGIAGVPIPSSDPYDDWDAARRHGRGILSLKHAAVLAGLGTMGKNTLLVNDRFGNMVWLGAVLVDALLEADSPADYEGCPAGCRICLDRCPQKALDGLTIDQSRCRAHSFVFTEGGEMVIRCNLCRTACPHRAGLRTPA
jgi:epoxyqueuosine reductase QueG